MDEEKLIRQIQEHMLKQGVTQAELGKRVAPDSVNPRQSINQYFTGKRSLLTGTGKAILDALDLELIPHPKDKNNLP